MTLLDFATKHRQVGSSIKTIVSDAVAELDDKLDDQAERRPPEHIPDQRGLIADAFETDERVWLLWFDGGRYDMFDQLVGEYFEGDLQRCYNGGVGYTGDWAVRNLTGDFGERGLFSYVPLRGFGAAEYDGRDHFALAPDLNAEVDVQERLAALGYAERSTTQNLRIAPTEVNDAVRRYQSDLNGGVVRYIAPHPPFDGLEDLTSESTKTLKTRQALQRGEITYAELVDAYRDTYRKAFRFAHDLIADLDGQVILTADHGECLTCGQLFHGRRLEMHDHLTTVPWFDVEWIV